MLQPAVAADPSMPSAPPIGVPRAEVAAESIRRYGVFVALGVTVLVGVLAVPNFATLANLDAVLRQVAVLGIVSLGQTFVILTAGIDLSVGMLMGLVTVLANGTLAGDASLIAVVVALALLVGLIVGVANAIGVVALTRREHEAPVGGGEESSLSAMAHGAILA